MPVIDLIPRPPWAANALCRGTDPDVFFPGRGRPLAPLNTICRACAYREACAAAGMSEPFGVWGGLGERTRRTLRRRGELVDKNGDTWMFDKATGEVVVVESAKPPLSPVEARALLESIQPASWTAIATSTVA